MVTVPNGVDVKQFKRGEGDDKVKRRYNLMDNKIVGYVGRISREKGIQHLIGAFKIVRDKRDDVKLLLIGPYLDSEYGDFIYYSDLVSKIRDYRIEDDAIFTGVIKHEELPPYYNACDILSFPSDCEEPFGIVSIEALACGKPVIVTDTGAFREIIRDGQNGFIVPKKNPHAIAEKIMLLLDDEALRKSISQAAAESAKYYSFESIAKRYEKLYEKKFISRNNNQE
ncbi:MAG: hypothetical protein A3J72_03190 [Nitrospirae bacterium RIFCSPHIGHO2_02_FULL_40_19]|nr:MAG: hypothetical protein A3J72_03190 [Nitrospirae bacterium RIFCSPHIGHO2_02_FULL_40_19]